MFKGEMYNIMTTNIVEALNSTLKRAREYPLLLLLDAIVEMMVDWFNERRETREGSEFDISTYTRVREMSTSCLVRSQDVGTYTY